ncbi:MAG: hypothetical protein MZV70_71520 [Desulfobacterales bacterium]|nr:hypothetical protein [Desulfobacterales bacterium]
MRTRTGWPNAWADGDRAARGRGCGWPLKNRPSRPLQTAAAAGARRAEPDELEIILTERTFGTEELSSYSACLETLAGGAVCRACTAEDADALGVRDGDRIADPHRNMPRWSLP